MFLCFSRFKRDDSGAGAVELALWMPFFWIVFGLIIDATMLFKYQTQFLDVAREASRQVSIAKMDQQEAYTYIIGKFPEIDNIQADILVDATSVTTTVIAPVGSLTVFSNLFGNQTRVNGKISMFMEEIVSPPTTPATGSGV